MLDGPEKIISKLERILPTVQKPGRYTGGELNQVVKNWLEIETKVALVFPDIYDLGMSNLGLAILYDLINRRSDTLAERVFAPWTDMEAALRDHDLPLYSLESKHALIDFDIIGFSLPYETLYTNTLNILELGGVPIFSSGRDDKDPLVIAGGHAAYNPEPMHAFIDAFVIGEGEEVIHEIVDAYQTWKKSQRARSELLNDLAKIWGVYVPALYEPRYFEDGSVSVGNLFHICIKRHIRMQKKYIGLLLDNPGEFFPNNPSDKRFQDMLQVVLAECNVSRCIHAILLSYFLKLYCPSDESLYVNIYLSFIEIMYILLYLKAASFTSSLSIYCHSLAKFCQENLYR